jgi:ADP-heptose:LPS heptosyltransferase
MIPALQSVLFIRRDNIGDLICTTPAIRAVRLRHPNALLAVLVNTYNAGAVANNPDIDKIYVYEKEKHAFGKGRLGVFFSNLQLIQSIRKERFSAAVACSYGYSKRAARFAYISGAKVTIGYGPSKLFSLSIAPPASSTHEVEAMMKLVEPLGASATAPGLVIAPSESELKKARTALKFGGPSRKLVAMHISSRKPANRWAIEKFRELGDMIQTKLGMRLVVLWAPGSSTNALHPGDDESAGKLSTFLKERPITYRTETLGELIAALSLVNFVICPDGGAMHIAAGLNKPILSIWGATDKKRWSPWKTPHIILQNASREASSITVTEAFVAFCKLAGENA